MATQDLAVTTQSQAMTTQASTMASHLTDFTRMNPSMFFLSKVNEYLQDFIHEVYKVLYAIGVSSNEKAELASY